MLETRGITPALAGTTASRLVQRIDIRDHPRACGDNGNHYEKECLISGSPPRLRGQREGFDVPDATAGITPALAGTTHAHSLVSRHSQDHPRACGDNEKFSVDDFMTPGSPPRLRGQHTVTFIKSGITRITPALAGTTYCLFTG